MKEQEAIRTFIRQQGLKQSALATAYGCNKAAISQFLSGKRPIPDMPKMLAAISKVMDGSVYFDVEITVREGNILDHFVNIFVLPDEYVGDDDEYEYQDELEPDDDEGYFGTCEG